MTAQETQLEQALALAQGKPGTAPSAVFKKLYIKTENSHVNLRKGPGTSYALIGTATRGNPDSEPMAVLSQSGDWFQVRLPDARTGWVADWLVEER
jgi:N-acetylmuramoyl-L-alanine amidase